MWKVYEFKQVAKNLKKYLFSIRKKYKIWIEVIKNGGSQNLKNFQGFRDKH